MNSEEFLAHHGVKGMQWGVRNEPEKSSAPASAQQRRERGKKWLVAIGIGAGVAAAGYAAYKGAKGARTLANTLKREAQNEADDLFWKRNLHNTELMKTKGDIAILRDKALKGKIGMDAYKIKENTLYKNKDMFEKSINRLKSEEKKYKNIHDNISARRVALKWLKNRGKVRLSDFLDLGG